MIFPFTFTSLLPYPFPFSGSSESRSPTPSPSRVNFANAEPTPTPGEFDTPRAGPSQRALPPRASRRALHANRTTGNGGDVFPAVSRKRGWEPSTCTQPIAATTARPVAGDFDTPSKYVGMRVADYQEDLGQEVPPAKRRRLGETIISTALSAALIGTAVGLTAYRLWRDRGKFADVPRQIEDVSEPEKCVVHESPPPYQEDLGWLETQRIQNLHAASPAPLAADSTPSDAAPSGVKRPPRRTRSSRALTPRKKGARRIPVRHSSPALNVAARYRESEYIPEPSAEPDEIEEQMDWMTERLRGLIEQGRQALGKQVVVMVDDDNLAGDAEEQGVEDDGSRDWEDDDGTAASSSSSSSRAASRLARGAGRFPSSISLSSHLSPATTMPPAASAPSHSLSHHPSSHVLRPSSSFSHAPSSYSHSHSIPIPHASSSSIADRDRFWQYSTAHARSMPAGLDDELISGSPELRESMERARRARPAMAPKT